MRWMWARNITLFFLEAVVVCAWYNSLLLFDNVDTMGVSCSMMGINSRSTYVLCCSGILDRNVQHDLHSA